jgi:hypothetical protein
MRYPSSGMIKNSMRQEGFADIERHDVEHILNIHVGEGVLNDPFIKHNATSQLALLSDEAYLAGIEKIKEDLKKLGINQSSLSQISGSRCLLG